MSPPLTLGTAGWTVAQARRVPFVFNIQDVFPDVAIELGHLKGEKVIRAARWLERTTYRSADAVTVLSDDLADNVRAKMSSVEGDDPARSTRARHTELRRHRVDSSAPEGELVSRRVRPHRSSGS